MVMTRRLPFSFMTVWLSFCLTSFPEIASSFSTSAFVSSSSGRSKHLLTTARISNKQGYTSPHYPYFSFLSSDFVPGDDVNDHNDIEKKGYPFDPKTEERNSFSLTRRDAFSLAIATASSVNMLTSFPSSAPASDVEAGSTAESPIVILGGSGRTAMAVAEFLASPQASRYVVTTTRTGRDPFQIVRLPAETKQHLIAYENPVNVRDVDSIRRVLKETGAKGVVFAASASKAGGSASEIDDVGVENTAIACRDVGARLVLVSALAVDRPTSKSYEVTNFMGGYLNGVMDAKLRGENKVRSMLKDYVIVRPGVLLSGKSKNGVLAVELNQGDTIGGGLSRDELAGIVWGAMVSGKKGVTVEAYRKSTRTGLQPEFVVPSGNELTADTYPGLFDNAKSD